MVTFQERTTNYDAVVKQQSKLSSVCTAWIAIIIILGLSLSIIAFFQNPIATVIIAILTIVVAITINSHFKNKFKANTDFIIQTYIEEYNITKNDLYIKYLSDNFNIGKKMTFLDMIDIDFDTQGIKPQLNKNLLCRIENNNIVFASRDFFDIKDISSYNYNYRRCILSDFGKMIIPINSIDYYLQKNNAKCVLVITCNEDLIKINFDSDNAFDNLIPKLEYYYNTAKKKDLIKP